MVYNNISSMPLVLTIPDIADTLQISHTSAYTLVANGELKALRVGKQIRVSRGSFAEFLTQDGSEAD